MIFFLLYGVDIATGAMLAIDYSGSTNVALNNQLTGGGQPRPEAAGARAPTE